MVKYFVGALCFALVLGSCEKAESNELDDNFILLNAKSALLGSWQHIEKIPSGLSEADFRYFDVEWIYEFNSDATYSHLVNFYGSDDENPNEIVGQSETLGTYEIQRDSVFIKGTVISSWDKDFNPEPTTTKLSGEAFGSRFKITDDTLSLFYLSYPADAPLQTQMDYKRLQ